MHSQRSPIRVALFVTWGILSIAGAGSAQAGGTPLTDSERKMLFEVRDRLLKFVDPEVTKRLAPDFLKIDQESVINAFATEGKEGAEIHFFTGLFNAKPNGHSLIDGHVDRVAMIFGHEMGHIALGHIYRGSPDPVIARLAFTRDKEFAADAYGMKLCIKAGYDFEAVRSLWKGWNETGLGYTSFEGSQVDHPSWEDRFAAIDKVRPELWKAMSAFGDGTYFLMSEDYPLAIKCFEAVTAQFPDCYEAWANLGCARLMLYCDGLKSEDLRRLGVGQMIIGSFYGRPESLFAKARDPQVKVDLWNAAVEALHKALELKPDLAVAKSNLGMALLVRPQGPDVAKGQALLQEAVTLASADSRLDSLALAAVHLNAGVADLAGGQIQASSNNMMAAQHALDHNAHSFTGQPAEIERMAKGIRSALEFDVALVQAASKDEPRRRAAVALFERYLTRADPSSPWWEVAYEKYAALGKQTDQAVQTAEALKSKAHPTRRPLFSLQLPSGVILALNEPLADVAKALGGMPQGVPVLAGSNLQRYPSVVPGIDLLANDRVLAIIVSGKEGPAVLLRSLDLAAKPIELHPGMTLSAINAAIGEQSEDQCYRPFMDPDEKVYHLAYYPGLGLAVQMDDDFRKSKELIIVHIPEDPYAKSR